MIVTLTEKVERDIEVTDWESAIRLIESEDYIDVCVTILELPLEDKDITVYWDWDEFNSQVWDDYITTKYIDTIISLIKERIWN